MLYLLHCYAGIDRTGVAAGAYAMQYQDASGPEALRINNKIAERVQHDKHIYDLIWYCYQTTYKKPRNMCLFKWLCRGLSQTKTSNGSEA